jgi:hypothetical protein
MHELVVAEVLVEAAGKPRLPLLHHAIWPPEERPYSARSSPWDLDFLDGLEVSGPMEVPLAGAMPTAPLGDQQIRRAAVDREST